MSSRPMDLDWSVSAIPLALRPARVDERFPVLDRALHGFEWASA